MYVSSSAFVGVGSRFFAALFIVRVAIIAISAYAVYAMAQPSLQMNHSEQANNTSISGYGSISCPLVLDNASESELLGLINDTKIENPIGACALAALSYYNGSGVLKQYNISVNLTVLNQQFLAGHPNLTTLNSSTATDSFSQTPNLFCVVTPPFADGNGFENARSWSSGRERFNRSRVLRCVAFTLPKRNSCGFDGINQNNSDQIAGMLSSYYNNVQVSNQTEGDGWLNQQSWQGQGGNRYNNASDCKEGGKLSFYRFNITIPSNVTNGPEVIYIPSADAKTEAIEFKNNTLVVVNYLNATDIQSAENTQSNNVTDPASPNWAGYYAYGDEFANVSGTWIVQTALSSSANRQSSQWVGIGGTSGTLSPLIQIGTHSNYNTGSGASYSAWYERYPFPESTISNFNVNPGDKIVANVGFVSNPNSIIQTWQLKIADLNTNSNSTINLDFVGVSLGTAEWIDERPGLTLYSQFTNFVNASYLSGNATSTSGVKKPIAGWPGVSKISMVNELLSGGVDLGNNANPTALNQTSGFNVTNFRIGELVPQEQNVILGENYSIKLITIYNNSALFNNNVTDAVGGTGEYFYKWQVELPGNTQYENLSCLVLGPAECTVHTDSSTETGTYKIRTIVYSIGGPSSENLTSAPATISVSAPVSTCGASAKVGITIYNNQGTATVPGFQQMITLGSASSNLASGEDSNLQNVEFFYANCTVIPAWIESGSSNSASSTVYWLKMPASIPAYSHVGIFIGLMPSSTNNFLNPLILGEAPQLSPTYGQYDNGAQVFNYYNNFASSTSGWTASSGTTATANHGLTVTFNQNGYFVGPSENYGTAFDVYVTSDAEINVGYINTGQTLTYLGVTAWASTVIREACGNTYPDQISQSAEANNCGIAHGSILPGTEAATGIFSVVPYSSSSSFQYIGYGTGSSSQPITTDAPGYPASVGLAQMRNGAQINSMSIHWARVRDAPPDGVMPGYAVDPPGNATVATSITTTSVTTTLPTNVSGNSTSTTTTTVATTITSTI